MHRFAFRIIADMNILSGRGRHIRQQASIISICVSRTANSLFQTHSVCTIRIADGCSALALSSQLLPVLPGICPGSIAGHITNGVTADGLSIIGSQKILPLVVAIRIINSLLYRSHGSGRVRILLLRKDITTGIIRIEPGFPRRLVIFSYQLLQSIIAVGCCLATHPKQCNIHGTVISVLEVPGIPSQGFVFPAIHSRGNMCRIRILVVNRCM